MEKNKVLLVEDATDVQLIVRASLDHFCEVECVKTVAEAESKISSRSYSLFILDVNLPDGQGFSVCEKIRTSAHGSETPVIFLTGQADVSNRVLGFALGADDYVIKPLESLEFAARVQAKFRRTKSLQTSISKGDLRIDLTTQKAIQKRAGGEVDLALTPIEFKLLANFMKNEGKTFSKFELLSVIWGGSVHVSSHTVDTHISSLRKKIGDSSKYLRSVVKKGYCFSLTEGDMPKTS
ncbi:MAG: response regulator transcription factor [Bdellovibrionales bacterium]|nr:response regulator transcription factor [Bdellovibrionales bacterium]